MDLMAMFTSFITWIPCGSAACVKVTKVDGGVELTSTLGEDKGKVVYTDAEWAVFVAAVKAGEADHTVREMAEATA